MSSRRSPEGAEVVKDASRDRRGRRRYAAVERERVLAQALKVSEAGGSVGALAREQGIPESTVWNWLQVHRRRTRAQEPTIRSVRVRRSEARGASPASKEGIVLVLREGHRVEGLDAATLVAVLQALA